MCFRQTPGRDESACLKSALPQSMRCQLPPSESPDLSHVSAEHQDLKEVQYLASSRNYFFLLTYDFTIDLLPSVTLPSSHL